MQLSALSCRVHVDFSEHRHLYGRATVRPKNPRGAAIYPERPRHASNMPLSLYVGADSIAPTAISHFREHQPLRAVTISVPSPFPGYQPLRAVTISGISPFSGPSQLERSDRRRQRRRIRVARGAATPLGVANPWGTINYIQALRSFASEKHCPPDSCRSPRRFRTNHGSSVHLSGIHAKRQHGRTMLPFLCEGSS